MDTFRLEEFVGGWFIGDFSPSISRTKGFEVAVKKYAAGDREASHHHRIAEEITVIALGAVRMAGQIFRQGDIVRIPANQSTDFEALEDSVTVVVKHPSVAGDKYVDSAPAAAASHAGD